MTAEHNLVARAYLSRVAEPANAAVWSLVRSHGPVEAAARIRSGDVGDQVRAATEARRAVADGEADLEAGARRGIRLVTPESADWPHFALAALEHLAEARLRLPAAKSTAPMSPPLALWVRGGGDLAGLGLRCVGLVGSRAATTYGEHVSAELAYQLAGRAFVVVSGGAYGIDAAAHRAALAAGGVTVIVSAGGLDRPYPAGNAALYASAADSGLLVSESPPGCSPHRGRFLTRNRLIAAFSTGTVVVEAARRSGALNTAAHCRSLGRPLMAVPGPVTSSNSSGCHALLRAEQAPAILVENADDIVQVIGSAGEGLPANDEASRGTTSVRSRLDALDPACRRVLDGFPGRASVSEDQLAVRSGVEIRTVLSALSTLRLAGLVESGGGGHRLSVKMRAAGRERVGAAPCDGEDRRAP